MLFALKINCHFSLPTSDPWHLTRGQKGQRSAILDLALKIASRPQTWIKKRSLFSPFHLKETLQTFTKATRSPGESSWRKHQQQDRLKLLAKSRPNSPHILKFLRAHVCLDSHQKHNGFFLGSCFFFITARMGARPRKCVVGFQSRRPNPVITTKWSMLHLGDPKGPQTINVNNIAVRWWKQFHEHRSRIEMQGQVFQVIHQEVAFFLAPDKV